MVRAGVVLAMVDGDLDVPHAVPPLVLLVAVLADALVLLVAGARGAPRVFVATVALGDTRQNANQIRLLLCT